MALAAIIGSVTSGHAGPFPPTLVASGSGNVLIEGIPSARVSDIAIPHTRTVLPFDSHQPVISAGSSKVFVNGLPAARIGDALQCGGTIATGCSKVFIGG